jgi:hypothetical protein
LEADVKSESRGREAAAFGDLRATGIRDAADSGLAPKKRGGAMRFLFLIHGDEQAEAALTADERRAIVGEHIAYAAMLRERGAYVHGDALEGRSSAAVVRPGEAPLVTDGPFAETKEALGGFYVVECASREDALELAGRVPASPGVAVEVLAIAEV